MDLTDNITLWWIAVIVAVVVTIVVAVLLALVIRTASDIRDGAAVIWARGQQVANNTIHIANLYRTRDLAEGITGRAGRILGHSEAIRDHARTCPGCPALHPWAGGRRMITLLTALTALAALLFLAMVAVALIRIAGLLEAIGGTGTSYLAKLRLGLRAIERETSHLPAAAPQVNEGLEQIAGGLTAVDATLGELHEALQQQEGRA